MCICVIYQQRTNKGKGGIIMIFGRKDNYLQLRKKLAERTKQVAKLIRSKIENLGSIVYS